MGQTGQNFKTRYKEHIQDIRNNKSKTGFSHHILNTGHAYDNIENTLKILNTQGKGPYLNTLEKFHICKTKKTGIFLTTNVLTPIIPSSDYYSNINITTIGNGSVYNLHPQQNIRGIQDMVESSKNKKHNIYTSNFTH
jgi:hypothetical protein